MFRNLRIITLVSLSLAVLACERSKSSSPLSPNVAGPMGGVSVDAPSMVSPAPGATLSDRDQPLTIVMGNPETNSPRPMTLGFQIAFDAGFANIAVQREGLAAGANGQTRLVLAERLPPGRTYFWRTKADDGANSSGWAGGVPFELQQQIVIGAPNPISPANNERATTSMPILVADNAAASGPYGQLVYQFQVSESAVFSGLTVNAEIGVAPNRTTYTLVSPLASDKTFYWRVRAFDPTTVGAWSRVEVFRSPLQGTDPVAPPPVAPGGGSPSQCGPPTLFNPLSILQCHRAFFPGGALHGDLAVEFLRRSTKSLNAAGTPGGPFGILRKTSGNNCGGYSCDIVCSGQGNAQRQWDVLVAEEHPTWGGSGAGVADGIRVDVCEIQ